MYIKPALNHAFHREARCNAANVGCDVISNREIVRLTARVMMKLSKKTWQPCPKKLPCHVDRDDYHGKCDDPTKQKSTRNRIDLGCLTRVGCIRFCVR